MVNNITPGNPQHYQYGKSDNCFKKDNTCTEDFTEIWEFTLVFLFNLLQTATMPLHFEEIQYSNGRPKRFNTHFGIKKKLK